MSQDEPHSRSGDECAPVAMKEYDLYKTANARVTQCYAQGCYAEGIAICEAVIASGLDARLRFLTDEAVDVEQLGTVGQLANRLLKLEADENPDFRELYETVSVWSDARNIAVDRRYLSADEQVAMARIVVSAGRKIMCAGFPIGNDAP